MSALGDYVHFKFKHYLNGGGRERTTADQLSASYNAQRQKINSDIGRLKDVDELALKEIEKMLKEHPFGEQNKKDPVSTEKVKEAIIKILDNKYGEDNVNNFIAQTLSSGSFGTWKKKKGRRNAPSTLSENEIFNLYRRIVLFTNKIKDFNSRIEHRPGTLQNYKNELDGILSDLKRNGTLIDSSTVNSFKQLSMEVSNLGKYSLKDRAQGEKVIDNLANQLRAVTYNNLFSLIERDWGELWTTACGNAGAIFGLETVDDIMDDLVSRLQKTANKTTSFSYKREGTKNNQDSKLTNYMTDILGNSISITHSSRDKVDTTISIKDKDYNLSLKTYRGSSGVTNKKLKLQDVNLFYSLVATVGDFGNHWLNLHCANSNDSFLKTKEVDELMSKTIAYEALAHGNMLKNTSSADIFTYIDPIVGTVKSVSIKDVLNNYNLNKDNFNFEPNISSIHFNNEFNDESVVLRLAEILKQTHQQKIAVSYNLKLK